jgi:DNA-binding NtrC family response regulator
LESPVKILVVDDDEVYRELLSDALEELEVEVVLCGDGVEALEKLQESFFDILITDLNMPRMDGLKLVGHARQLYPQILAIIITGYGSLESAIEAIREGAYDYVQKPFKIEQIKIVSRNAIEKIQILRDKAELLKQLEVAYRRLQSLETECHSKQNCGDVAPSQSALEGVYSLSPRQAVPLYFLDTPYEPSDHILTKLERMKELRREGVITDNEFSLLKKIIINKLGSGQS